MILVFAFADWPIDKELRHYRQGGYGPRPGGYPEPPWPGQPSPGYDPAVPSFLRPAGRRPAGWLGAATARRPASMARVGAAGAW